MNVLKTTELYTLIGCLLWYISYFKEKEREISGLQEAKMVGSILASSSLKVMAHEDCH